jgi:hypothetical protein
MKEQRWDFPGVVFSDFWDTFKKQIPLKRQRAF